MGVQLGIWATLKSWRFWVLAIIPETLLQLLWQLFSKLFGIMPIFRDIFAGAIFIAVIFALAWAVPKYALQYAGGKTRADNVRAPTKPSRLIHDNVLWEDGGKGGWGIYVIGPLCPKDFTPLGCVRRNDKIENLNCNNTISDSDYSYRLICPECRNKYTLGKEPKTIRESEDEVRKRFEGLRRRELEVHSGK